MVQKEEKKGFHHRSSLKQKNKPFKGGPRSNSRGRIERKKITTLPSVDLSKRDRKNRATMVQHAKREELATLRRAYAGRDGMPRIIVVIPLSSSVDMNKVLPFATSELVYSECNKQNLQFVPIHRSHNLEHSRWIMQILDAVQVADCVLLVASSLDGDLDGFGRDALAIIRSIGISSSAAIIQELKSHKNPQNVRSTWLGIMKAGISSITKVYCTDSMFQQGDESRELVEFERTLCQQHLNGISWRDTRPYMITDGVETDGSTVKVTGFIRGGKAFSANKLVHLPVLGAHYTVSRIEALSKTQSRVKKSEMDVDEESLLIQIRNEEAETLESECTGDMFSADAMMQAAEGVYGDVQMNGAVEGSITRQVPKGTSNYQAAWIPEDEMIDANEEPLEELKLEDDKVSDIKVEDDDIMDMEEHTTRLAEHKLQFSERHYPDEIELDPRISARTRLQKYRGVQSLRTSTWDPNENLPTEYGRIFRFANPKQSRKIALEEDDSPFHIGQRIAIYIEGISAEGISVLMNTGRIAIFGLLKHEQRQTVLNFTLTRSKTFKEPLLNKEELVAVIGMRKYTTNPIWSDHGTTNLHKLFRQVDPEQNVIVGTIYGPVAYTPTPILLFKRQTDSDELLLVGCGSITDTDPHRVILKRITLTGTPFRVHKRSAVVRFMFSNPADIDWFKPVELSTRLGARGHIRESLGTHGYMKCLFERTIFHHDTVALHLYKRVFPKWTTSPLVSP
jgi:pre-rRNA-processing protein TSR1